MNANVQNGGLVLKHGSSLFLTDINGSGTSRLRLDGETPSKTSGLCWFMNSDEEYIYYSDQTKEHFLCQMEIRSGNESLLIEKPCYQVTLHEQFVYFINENDHMLYRCNTNGRNVTKLIDDQVESFVLYNGQIIYATPQGIRMCQQSGGARKKLSDATASMLIQVGDKLVFADRRHHHALTLLDLNDDRVEVLSDIETVSLNTDGTYLYCANQLNDRTIYRVDPLSGRSIRICGESADYLHVIEDDIYFMNSREWYKLSLTGGEATKVDL